MLSLIFMKVNEKKIFSDFFSLLCWEFFKLKSHNINLIKSVFHVLSKSLCISIAAEGSLFKESRIFVLFYVLPLMKAHQSSNVDRESLLSEPALFKNELEYLQRWKYNVVLLM